MVLLTVLRSLTQGATNRANCQNHVGGKILPPRGFDSWGFVQVVAPSVRRRHLPPFSTAGDQNCKYTRPANSPGNALCQLCCFVIQVFNEPIKHEILFSKTIQKWISKLKITPFSALFAHLKCLQFISSPVFHYNISHSSSPKGFIFFQCQCQGRKPVGLDWIFLTEMTTQMSQQEEGAPNGCKLAL